MSNKEESIDGLSEWSTRISAVLGLIIVPYILSYWYQKAYWDFLGVPWVLHHQNEFTLLLSSEKVFSYILSVGGAIFIASFFRTVKLRWYVLLGGPSFLLSGVLGYLYPHTFVEDILGSVPLAIALSLCVRALLDLVKEYKRLPYYYDELLESAASKIKPEVARMFKEIAPEEHADYQKRTNELKETITASKRESLNFQLFAFVGPMLLVGILLLYSFIFVRASFDAYLDSDPRQNRLTGFYDKDGKRYLYLGTTEAGMIAFTDFGKGYVSSVYFIPNENGPFVFDFGKKFRVFNPPSTLESSLKAEEADAFTDESLTLEARIDKLEGRFKEYRLRSKTEEQKRLIQEVYERSKNKLLKQQGKTSEPSK